MNDVRKSALWALISVPISLFGYFNAVGLSHADNFFLIPFMPGALAIAMMGDLKETPLWVMSIAGLTAQYLGYFLFIVSIRKFWKLGDKITEKEQSEKDPPGP